MYYISHLLYYQLNKQKAEQSFRLSVDLMLELEQNPVLINTSGMWKEEILLRTWKSTVWKCVVFETSCWIKTDKVIL